ncbi:MAG: vbsP [Hyphomicrobiales bacterium]|nr:vbsP [Hyphomicrobiales bacterium]
MAASTGPSPAPPFPLGVQVEYLETTRIDARGWDALLACLPDDELARAGRFRFERDRQVYIAGHALVRDMLSRQAGGARRDWRFTLGAHGKPAPVLPADAPDLRINLSHTLGVAVVALAWGADVGVDVEWMSRTNDLDRIAHRFFAPDECRQFDAAAPEARRELFFAFWTLKEAYIKATGLGLAMPLADFAFDLAGPTIAFAPHVDDAPGDWCFWRQPLLEDHALAIALRRPAGATPPLNVAAADLDRLLGD